MTSIQANDERNRKSYEKVGRIYNLLKRKMNKIYLENLLQQEGDINYKITEGTTEVPNLLCEAIYLDELFVLLVEHGADFTYKDKEGRTAVHSVVQKYSEGDLLWMLKSHDFTHYVDAILNAHVKYNNFSNPSDKNGMTHFHAACMTDNGAAVEFFLKNGVDVNQAVNKKSKYYPSYTPLHFAVEFNRLKVIEILLIYGANVHLKNAAGLGPLHVIIKERLEAIDNPQGRCKQKSPVQCNEILKVFVNFAINNANTVDNVDDYGFSNLHAGCLLQDESLVEKILEKNKNVNEAVHFDSTVCPGYTALHFAALSKVEIFKLLLDNGADIGVENSKGETPIDLCIQNYSAQDIYFILMSIEKYRNIMMSDSKTKLVSVVFDMSKPFSNNATTDLTIFVPFDSPLWPGYTLLHLAVTFTKGLLGVEKIQDCLERGADVTAKNAKGLTPLDLTANMKESWAIRNLLDGQSKDDNAVDNDLERGADTTKEKAKGSTLSDLAVRMKKLKVVKNLFGRFNKPDNRVVDNNVGHSQNRLLVTYVEPDDFPEIMRNNKLNILETPSLLSVANDDLSLTINNLEYGMDNPQNTSFLDRMTRIFQCLTNQDGSSQRWVQIYTSAATAFQTLKFVRANPTNNHGVSLFHIACLTANGNVIEKFINHGVDVDQTISYFSNDCPGCTPLHLALQNYCKNYKPKSGSNLHVQTFLGIVDVLLDNGADVNAADAFGETPLFQAIQLPVPVLRQTVINKLISYGANIHVINVKGITPFELLLKFRYTWEEIEIFLKARCSFGSYNPITQRSYMSIAFRYYCTSQTEILENRICREIINNPKISEVDNLGRSAIHNLVSTGFEYPSYRENERYDNFVLEREVIDPMDCKVWAKLIELFVKRGCDIDQQDNEGKTALHLAVHQQNYFGVYGLLKNGADVNLTDKDGKTVLTHCYLSSESHGGRTSDRHHQLRAILGMHMYKLKFCGEYVNGQHKELRIEDDFLMDYNFENDDFIRFHEEMKRTASMKIGKTFELSVDEFLTRNNMDMIYMNLARTERIEVDQFFEDIDKYKFEEIDCLLRLKYRRNIERIKLIEPALASFNVWIKNQLPDLCCRHILSFLKIHDLKQLIASTV